MNTFKALVVDDDPKIMSEARNAFPESSPIKVLTASSLSEARLIVQEHFIHAAFVDLQLQQKGKNIDGKTLLRELLDLRPSCRRFLLTQFPEKYRRDLFDLLHPLNPIIDGALDKIDYRDNFQGTLEQIANKWLKWPIAIDNIDELYGLLEEKRVRGTGADLTKDEIDYLISRLLGQGIDGLGKTPEDVDRISLQLLEGGRSRSIVALGKPRNKVDKEGIFCVFKIGPRLDTHEEYTRYRRYVQFLLSLNRRVELLGYVSGDTLGVVCYSFAGKSPESIFSLATLFNRQDSKALECVRMLIDPGTQEWYGHDRVEQDLAKFFSTTYHLDAYLILDSVVEFAERIAGKLGATKIGGELHFAGGKLLIPKDVIGSGKMRTSYRACIIHGDLNAENVIISDDDRVMCIDFRYTGWGPRSLDFAALQISLRLSTPVLTRDITNVLADHHLERRLWRLGWRKEEGPPHKELAEKLPYWATTSLGLLDLARRNFPDLTEDEHAATCLLCALRVFRVTGLSEQARLRLLIWMCTLSDALMG